MRHDHKKWLASFATFFLIALALPGATRFAGFGWQGGDPSFPTARGNDSDRALALYNRATELVAARRDAEAVALLGDVRHLPLVITPRSGGGPAPDDISSAALMVRLGSALCARAAAHAIAGNTDEAWFWTLQARGVAAHVLRAQPPTLDAVLTARAIDTNAGRTEVEVARKSGDGAAYAASVRREKNLRAFYDLAVRGEVIAARKYRAGREAEVGLRYDGGEREQALRRVGRELDRVEMALAADLVRRYSANRTTVLAQTEPFPNHRAAAVAAAAAPLSEKRPLRRPRV